MCSEFYCVPILLYVWMNDKHTGEKKTVVLVMKDKSKQKAFCVVCLICVQFVEIQLNRELSV
jgi:nicotinamide riboside transporter PnuC